MELVFVVILLALLEYSVFSGLVGRARGRYGVKAPAMTGHPQFERAHRVHQNTLEALIVFVPAVWIYGLYVSAKWGAALGLVFIVARAIYAVGYLRDPEKRGPGAGLTFLVNGVLLIWGLVALAIALARGPALF
jgi:glutathione S-transferase